jgi:hypothetical protein
MIRFAGAANRLKHPVNIGTPFALETGCIACESSAGFFVNRNGYKFRFRHDIFTFSFRLRLRYAR